MSAPGSEVSVRVYVHENPTRKSQCTIVCVTRGGTPRQRVPSRRNCLKPSHAHQSPLPTGILGSSNRVPEICDQIDGVTWETGTGTQAKRSRFRSPVFFSGESDCVSDDWNDRITQGLDSVCKLCCLMNRRGLGSVLREISADHRQLDCAAGSLSPS